MESRQRCIDAAILTVEETRAHVLRTDQRLLTLKLATLSANNQILSCFAVTSLVAQQIRERRT